MILARALLILYTVQLNARFTLNCNSFSVLHIAHFTKHRTLYCIIYLYEYHTSHNVHNYTALNINIYTLVMGPSVFLVAMI